MMSWLGLHLATSGCQANLHFNRMTYDRGPTNPTASNLIEAITHCDADRLRRDIKQGFADARPSQPLAHRELTLAGSQPQRTYRDREYD